MRASLERSATTPEAALLDALRALARDASVELSPRQLAALGPLGDYLPRGTPVYVPFVPGATWGETSAACRRLRAAGMSPVPHLPARWLASTAQLDDWLAELAEVQVRELLLVAGDRASAAGPYRDTLDVLDSGRLVATGFRRVGITGYPEGHPSAPTADLDAALTRKLEYAAATGTDLWITTQFTFAPAHAIAWLDRMRDRGCTLPVRVGLPGPARLRTLLAFAGRCGVTASARMLTRRPSVVRLLKRWTPDALLRQLVEYRGMAGSPAFDIHVFTFGGLPATARWLRGLRADSATRHPRATVRSGLAPLRATEPGREVGAALRPVVEIAQQRLGVSPDLLTPYGHYKAKLTTGAVRPPDASTPGKLVLVTAMSPTPAGEGKTTTSIGLTDALNRLGVRATVCLREPSLGPCFGRKGGATGGGRAQVAPAADINLHFNGDLHAVSTANNLLAAALDNHIHWNNQLDVDPATISWSRVMDLNDRALREIDLHLRGDARRAGGFDITAASEVMAVLCLARDHADLVRRLGAMVVAFTRAGQPVTARELQVDGAMAALLTEALQPNLVQTLEGNAAFVHGGPFANIAHGCSSLAATRAALKLSEVVVTEAGFGADLGAEKFLDIKCRQSGLRPDAVVLVCTVRALKMHAGVARADLAEPDPDAVRLGAPNLARHIANLRRFGVTPVVAANRFATDTDDELSAIEAVAREHDVRCVVANHWADGGAGATALARTVLDQVERPARIELLYPDEMPLREKIETVARRIHGAGEVFFETSAAHRLFEFERLGYGHLPVCIAKTQYSFSTDPKALGDPVGHVLPVREVRLCAGAGFVVALCGEILTMPGLPRRPAAADIGIDDAGRVIGL
ncbi:MAG: formate--tetrahydrofolate ligase [Gammaproteobacteria bacterium]|nr:formate--tetrahydrofolate ligase [Gammaproteobacteria bacterium]